MVSFISYCVELHLILAYAVKREYTHIEAIVLEDGSEVEKLRLQQAKTEHLYIPEEFIKKWRVRIHSN